MHLDHYLEENKYTAGSHLTIADFAIISTISTIDVSMYVWIIYKQVANSCNRNSKV